MDEWVNGWPHVKSLKSNKSLPIQDNSIMDIFLDILLKPLSPLWGYFFFNVLPLASPFSDAKRFTGSISLFSLNPSLHSSKSITLSMLKILYFLYKSVNDNLVSKIWIQWFCWVRSLHSSSELIMLPQIDIQ